jgi:RNA recognition motif-containing protein
MGDKIFVGNLPFSASKEDMEVWFRPFGDIIGINLRTDR